MKYQILIEILILLLSHKKVTVKEIMDRFELPRRTVFRYIDTISLAKIPIVAVHGRNGGFYIPDEYKITCSFFNDEELSCLKQILQGNPVNQFNPEIIQSILDKINCIPTVNKCQ